MNSRKDLAIYFKELNFKIGAEIGVLGGKYSETICLSNPGVKLYCVDSWGDGERRLKDYHLRKYEEAKKRLTSYNTVLVHKFSMDAVKEFEDGSLDFVYIDANHDPNFVREDIAEWSKKVRKGGILSGHDYALEIAKVVDEFVKNNNYKLNLTGPDMRGITWWLII